VSLDEIEAQKAAEKVWWEKRRGQIQSEFMKELDDSDKVVTKEGASEDDAVLVDTPAKGKKGKK
jgi:translocation protein SEC66